MKEYLDVGSKYRIRLNSNESYIEIDDNLKEEIQRNLSKIELRRYPENNMDKIKTLYAKYAMTNPSNIIVGNGSDEMLQLVISTYISSGKKLLTFSPDFVMYDFYTNSYGGEVIKFDLGKNIEFDVNSFISLGKKENVDLIIFSNPNNPTGLVVSEEDIKKILEDFKNIPVVVDEAYYEFYGESMIFYINDYDNLIVTRTLSKAWGLASIRVGFLISNKCMLEKLINKKVPYTVNSYSQVVAETVLSNVDRVIDNLNITINNRKIFLDGLRDIEKKSNGNIVFYESKSNFIFGRTGNKELLMKLLEAEKILIRNFKDDSFRITVGSRCENDEIINVISKFVNGGEF